MDRRELFRLSAAGAALSALPGWIQRAFGPLGVPASRLEALAAAREAAGRAGKPLLVFVIPENASERHERGTVLGGLLNHGGDEALADLALVEVACAPMHDVRRAFGDEVPAGEPWLVLIERPTGTPAFTALDPAFPEEPAQVADPWEHLEERAKARIDAAAKTLRRALAGDRPALIRRSEDALRALPPESVEALRAALAKHGRIDADLAFRGAAVVRAVAEHEVDRREDLLHALAQATRERIVTQPPLGAKWARSGGCGSTIEGEAQDAPGVACGMAMIPRISQRFLWFFAQGDRD
jgi:hypothetical protein